MEEKFMRRAIELAKLGVGRTSPNPIVGCVVVKNGKIIGEGYHKKYGKFHAERNALLNCTEDAAGAELYVTLEPCCHQGKTPPCTDIIIEKGIKKVYVGSSDPNPLVNGGGNKILRNNSIEVVEHVLEEECDELNEIYFYHVRTGLPFVAMKYAMTLDGKIATYTGDSKWITGEEARKHVHYLRKKYAAIMTGIGTVIADDPMLNCRIDKGVDPLRIICDTHLRIPLDSQIVKTAKKIKTVVVCGFNADVNKEDDLNEKGINVIRARDIDDTYVELKKLIRFIGDEYKIDSILIEGGGTLNASALEQDIVNKVYAYVAPKLIGGAKAGSPVGGTGIEYVKDAAYIRNPKITRFGDDFCIEGRLN